MKKTFTHFICPICGKSLIKEEKRYFCEENHCFDISRQGYVNLLMSQKSGARGIHGDNREMIVARRKFLNSGSYAPLRDTLCREVAAHISENAVLLDAGCGEGYYTEGIARVLPEAAIYGIDISKDALSLMHSRQIPVLSAVASVYHMPFADDTFDAAVSVFSPFAREEFLRILKDRGMLFSVIPSKKHLFGLKSAIYDTPYENEVAPYEVEGFEFIDRREISYTLTLGSHDEIDALFRMTPYCYRTSDEGRRRVAALDRLETEVGFEILIYKKR